MASPALPEGLRVHLLAMLLDELELAAQTAKPEPGTLQTLLGPAYGLVGSPATPGLLFKTTLKEVFETMLVAASEEALAKEEEEDEEGEEEKEAKGLDFDHASIADELFQLSKAKTFPSGRRQAVYKLITQYNHDPGWGPA